MNINYSKYRQKQKRLLLPDGAISYIDEGEGFPIMLVHGVPSSSWLYRKLIPLLVQAGFRVIAPDLLGYGSSDKPHGYHVYAAHLQGRRLLHLMKHLGISQWHHVCHDAGGLWTWEMLKMEKERVKKLILLNTIIYEAGFQPPLRFKTGPFARLYTNLYGFRLTASLMMKATLKNGVSQAVDFNRNTLEGYVQAMKEGGYRGIYHFFTQTCKKIEDYRPLIKELECDTCVIWGAKDPILRWHAQSEELTKDLNISDENIFILEDCKHFIQEEAPEKIARLIINFTES